MKRSWCPGPASRVPLRTLLFPMPPENSPREPPEWCRSAHAALSMSSVSQQCFQAVEGTPAGRRGGHPTTWPDALRTATKHRCDTANIDDGGAFGPGPRAGRGPRHGLGTSTARHGFSGARFAQVVSGLSDHLRRLLPLL